jgi:DNA-binding transcriptional LysR family regulator
MNLSLFQNHLDKLHAFSVVARTGSFRKASVILRTSQPSLSRSVKILESILNQPLLQRTRQGVHLTKAGSTLYEMNERISLELERFEHQLKITHQTLSARLNVGSFESLAISIWPKFIKKVSVKYPELSISLKTACDGNLLQQKLFASQLDLILVHSSVLDPRLISRRIWKSEMGIYIAPGLMKRKFSHSSKLDLSCLHQVPLILVPSAVYDGGETLDHLVQQTGILNRQIVYELDSFEAAKEFILEEIGIGILPKWMIRKSDQTSILEVTLPGIFTASFGSHTISVVFKKVDRQDLAIQTLIREMDFLSLLSD